MVRPVSLAAGALAVFVACSAPTPREPSPLNPVTTTPMAAPATSAWSWEAVIANLQAQQGTPIGASAPPPEPPAPVPGAPTLTPEQEAKRLADTDRAISAVAALPGARGLCQDATARGARGCSIYIGHVPTVACPRPGLSYEHLDCWWGVVLAETMGDGMGGGHQNRLATLYVEPVTFEVMAAEDGLCPGLFTLEAFRKLKVRQAKGQHDCEGALPLPAPP